MNQSRRKFIRITSLLSVSALDISKAVANVLEVSESYALNLVDEKFDKELEFHIIDNNLLNLHFYFINVEKKGFDLSPKDDKAKSFMIVRLPQQHITEKGYFIDEDQKIRVKQPTSPTAPNTSRRPKSELSGFSFLAFQLWPEYKAGMGLRPSLRCNEEAFLNWNSNYLKLITLIEWLHFQKMTPTDLPELAFTKIEDINNKNGWINVIEMEKPVDGEPKSIHYLTYKSRIKKLFKLKDRPDTQYLPVSFFEIPNKLLLVPFFRAALDKKKTKIKFYENKIKGSGLDPSKIKPSVTKYEVWSNRLAAVPDNYEKGASPESNFVIENPCFRAVGVISKDALKHEIEEKECEKECEKHKTNFLPTLLDQMELAYLTQYANDLTKPDEKKEFTKSDFDIKELNGFFFTGLGVITHLKYYNVDEKPPGIDLIEYEHIIEQGRDVFIKVSRLGYNSKTGQKYKHVIEGKRKNNIQINSRDGIKYEEPTSFIELKQYCECIDREINYELLPDDHGSKPNNFPSDYFRISKLTETDYPINKPVQSNQAHYRRFPFKHLKVYERKRIPIHQLKKEIYFPMDSDNEPDLCKLQCSSWFWPIIEKPYTEFSDLKIGMDEYLNCEYEATDWEGKLITARTPFLFIRASLIEKATATTFDEVYQNYFKGALDQEHNYFLRRKTFFNNQKIGFTPGRGADDVKNKANIIETEFIDTYFNFRPTGVLAAQKVPYVLLPQLLRTKSFTDHVKDLTSQKIPSVLEYHKNYVKDEFIGDNNDGAQIFNNTEAFMKEGKDGIKEELPNQTYPEIQKAIHQAKDKMGNVETLDFSPDSISLKEHGITLPVNVKFTPGTITKNGISENVLMLRPKDILRGKFSEILGGIDLRVILNEFIDEKDSPLFEINKIANEIENTVINSSVYREIKDEIDGVARTINNFKNQYESKKKELNDQYKDLQKQIKALSKEFPNVDDLRNIVKTKFEELKTEVFDINLAEYRFNAVKKEIDDVFKKVIVYVKTETKLIQGECVQKLEEVKALEKEVSVTEVLGQIEVRPEFNAIRQYLKDVETAALESKTKLLDKYFNPAFNLEKEIETRADHLYKTVEETKQLIVNKVAVYYNKTTFEFEKPIGDDTQAKFLMLALDKAGLLQLDKKAKDIRFFIDKNIKGNKFQSEVVEALEDEYTKCVAQLEARTMDAEALKKVLSDSSKDLKKKLDKLEQEYIDVQKDLKPEVKRMIKTVSDSAMKLNGYFDLVRKLDPYFYYQEFERTKKEVADIKKRIHEDVYKKCTDLLKDVETKYDAIYKETSAVAKYDAYKKAAEDYIKDQTKLDDLNKAKAKFDDLVTAGISVLNEMPKTFLTKVFELPEYNNVKVLYEAIVNADNLVKLGEDQVKTAYDQYMAYFKKEGEKIKQNITDIIQGYIESHQEEVEKIKEARKIYNLLISLKQQDLTYKWRTQGFRDADFGIITFKTFANPPTELQVNVKSTVHFEVGKFPPAVSKVATSSESRFTNFGIGFFNIITIAFSEVSFYAGSNRSTDFNIKIKDVKFDGAFSFVQAFESYMKTIGKGLLLKITNEFAGLSYTLPIPSIQTPTFSFFNLTLGFDFRIHFDKRPMRFGFSLATPDAKFGIAAGIFAGFGFFSFVGDPKRGIVEIDTALEAGAWTGIRMGPISGEVKLAFGFRYTKNDLGVRLEGYIVAEGRLSFWIFEVSARIYLGVVSEGSSVSGRCTVTYTVKVWGLSKSFSGTFTKTVAGAQSNNQRQESAEVSKYIENYYSKQFTPKAVEILYETLAKLEDEVSETYAVSNEEWEEFILSY
jgi:hypothetical protein